MAERITIGVFSIYVSLSLFNLLLCTLIHLLTQPRHKFPCLRVCFDAQKKYFQNKNK